MWPFKRNNTNRYSGVTSLTLTDIQKPLSTIIDNLSGEHATEWYQKLQLLLGNPVTSSPYLVVGNSGGLIKQLIDRLSSDDDWKWLNRVEKFLLNDMFWKSRVWKTITVGGKDLEYYKNEFAKRNIDLTLPPASNRYGMEKNFTDVEREVHLIRVPLRVFGGNGNALNFSVLEDNAYTKGLRRCSLEIALELRLTCTEQLRPRMFMTLGTNYSAVRYEHCTCYFDQKGDNLSMTVDVSTGSIDNEFCANGFYIFAIDSKFV